MNLPEVLTQSNATACLSDLGAAMRAEPVAVLVNASGLNRFDSSALAVLLALRREALQLGKTFSLQGTPQRLGDLARLYGIAGLLGSDT